MFPIDILNKLVGLGQKHHRLNIGLFPTGHLRATDWFWTVVPPAQNRFVPNGALKGPLDAVGPPIGALIADGIALEPSVLADGAAGTYSTAVCRGGLALGAERASRVEPRGGVVVARLARQAHGEALFVGKLAHRAVDAAATGRGGGLPLGALGAAGCAEHPFEAGWA